MKSYTENLPKFMSHHLKMTSIAMFFISACVVIPKNMDTTKALRNLSINSLSVNVSDSLTTSRANSVEREQTYIPPNYRGPDSEHGSGTR